MDAPTHLAEGDGSLEAYCRRAEWTIRRERLRNAVGIVIWTLLVGAVGWTAAIYWQPELALGAPAGAIAAIVLIFLAADAALFWKLDRRGVLLRIDRQLGLADATISSSELASAPRDEWRRRQVAQTVAQIGARSWDEHWPRRWPRLTGLAATALAAFGALLVMAYFVEKAAAQPVPTPFLTSQMQGLEQVFQDWDEAERKTDDPEMRKLLAEVKPLREKMEAGQVKEKEALVALSRIEEKLEAAKKALEGKSLESSAAELASSFEPLEGMSAMASALRRKDFEEAEKLAASQAEKLAQPGAKTPAGSEDQANQQRVSNTAKNLEQRGQQGASDSLQQMAQGMKQGDPKSMSEGVSGLKQCLGSQAKRDAEKQRLNTQLAQMGQCKDCLGSGKSLCRGMSLMPKLALEKKPGGKGAGSEIDPNRFGAETQLASNRTEEKLTGALDAGDSEITTEKTTEKPRETASSARQASLRQYEQLSREAIGDENIPLAHRQTIRRYFEMIRPAEK